VHFTRHPQRGFVGSCTYQLRGPDEPAMPEAPLTVRQQIFLLAMFAFYCGIGYKTAMGMGQVRPSFIGQEGTDFSSEIETESAGERR
jgi:CRISPR-associated endoribonuclease Cas6